jgi:hypothetical protein
MTDNQSTELAALRKQVEQLSLRVNGGGKISAPVNAYDPTAKMTLPPSAVQAMCDAIDPQTLRAIVGDSRRLSPVAARPVPSQNRNGTGWIEPRPLSTPPGTALIDRLCDAADNTDRRAAERRAADREALAKLREANTKANLGVAGDGDAAA